MRLKVLISYQDPGKAKMLYNTQKHANSILSTLHGKLAEAECKDFQEAIAPLIKGETENFYLDMRDLTLIDSVGMGMGIKMSCKRRGRRLVILSPSQEVQAAFSMVRFDQVLDISCPAKKLRRFWILNLRRPHILTS